MTTELLNKGRFTNNEDEFISKWYYDLGPEETGARLNRNSQSIRQRAILLRDSGRLVTQKRYKRGYTPTPDELKELFSYDEKTGILYWKGWKAKSHNLLAGSRVSSGRLRVEINGITYGVHRVVFAMHHGRWSSLEIDHIDRDVTNNRIGNLREANKHQNAYNRKGHSRTGHKGVTFHKGRYIARISANGRGINLGSFDSAGKAAEAYGRAASEYHGEFACREI